MGAEGDQPKSGLSKEAWGAIATITVALITAGVTLTTHYWSPKSSAAPPSAPPAAATSQSTASADVIAGRWAGTATDEKNQSFRIEVDIAEGCVMNARCGTISVSHVPCKGAIYLNNLSAGDYEFRVDNFDSSSAKTCEPGAGEHFQPGPDGTLIYSTSYPPRAHAILNRQD